MVKIFISFRKNDDEFRLKIKEDLENNHFHFSSV